MRAEMGTFSFPERLQLSLCWLVRRFLRVCLCDEEFRSRGLGWGVNPDRNQSRKCGFRASLIRDVRQALRLFWIKAEGFELPAPFRRRIAKPFHADTAGQATFYGCRDKVGSQEGQ